MLLLLVVVVLLQITVQFSLIPRCSNPLASFTGRFAIYLTCTPAFLNHVTLDSYGRSMYCHWNGGYDSAVSKCGSMCVVVHCK